ncbi:MAG: tripartite tricarboxylate transporter substrate binding protein, partial [Betaproteobacteria bacterium]|nr:tripartite tricarboxylate transporter substrate binding protein [Betaproteobacteria bacterium]
MRAGDRTRQQLRAGRPDMSFLPIRPSAAARVLTLLLGLAGGLSANAQDYPSKPIRMVVPFAPGSTTDTLARFVSDRLSRALGQQILIDNRAGAGGNIGTEMVARTAADGYTLVTAPSSLAINAALMPNLGFDAVRDLAPVVLIGAAPLIIVATPGLPAGNAAELIALARARPGQLNYASGGSGSPSHLAMELFKSMAGIDVVHIPYKGGGALLNSVMSGEIQLTPSGVLIAVPLIRAGRLKAIAVTGSKRIAAAPDVPTVAESGLPGYHVSGWWGILAP